MNHDMYIVKVTVEKKLQLCSAMTWYEIHVHAHIYLFISAFFIQGSTIQWKTLLSKVALT